MLTLLAMCFLASTVMFVTDKGQQIRQPSWLTTSIMVTPTTLPTCQYTASANVLPKHFDSVVT